MTRKEKLLEAARLVAEVVKALDKTTVETCVCGKRAPNNEIEYAQTHLLKGIPHRLRVAAEEISATRDAIWLRANSKDEITRLEAAHDVVYVLESPALITRSGFYEIVLLESGKCRLDLLEAREEPPPGYPG